MISVLILSPIPALRAGLRALLSADPEISVVGAVSDWAMLPDDLAPEAVEVVVAAGGVGLDALPGLPPGAAILLVSGDGEEVAALLRRMALEGGQGPRGRAWGAVAPDEPGEALQKAVHALAEGLVTLSPTLAEALLAVLSDSAALYADMEDAALADSQGAGGLYPARGPAGLNARAGDRSAAGGTGAGGAGAAGARPAPGSPGAPGLPQGPGASPLPSGGYTQGNVPIRGGLGEAAGPSLNAGEQGDSTLSPAERLTPRETEVLRQMADGLTNKQIALALGISEHTVKFHVSAIYAKLGAANRAEAVRRGAQAGWLPI